jgi:hypothetical protein
MPDHPATRPSAARASAPTSRARARVDRRDHLADARAGTAAIAPVASPQAHSIHAQMMLAASSSATRAGMSQTPMRCRRTLRSIASSSTARRGPRCARSLDRQQRMQGMQGMQRVHAVPRPHLPGRLCLDSVPFTALRSLLRRQLHRCSDAEGNAQRGGPPTTLVRRSAVVGRVHSIDERETQACSATLSPK